MITTTETQAVKIDMTVEGKSGATTRTQTYHTTAILKNS
jgi:hypothetical protein